MPSLFPSPLFQPTSHQFLSLFPSWLASSLLQAFWLETRLTPVPDLPDHPSVIFVDAQPDLQLTPAFSAPQWSTCADLSSGLGCCLLSLQTSSLFFALLSLQRDSVFTVGLLIGLQGDPSLLVSRGILPRLHPPRWSGIHFGLCLSARPPGHLP